MSSPLSEWLTFSICKNALYLHYSPSVRMSPSVCKNVLYLLCHIPFTKLFSGVCFIILCSPSMKMSSGICKNALSLLCYLLFTKLSPGVCIIVFCSPSVRMSSGVCKNVPWCLQKCPLSPMLYSIH